MKKKIRERLDGKMARIKREYDFLDSLNLDVEKIDDDTKKLAMKKFCDFVHRCNNVVSYAEQKISYAEMYDYVGEWFTILGED